MPGDHDDDRRRAHPRLAEQPLTGLGGGETIREVHQDTPFSLVALTADDLTGTSARVRAKKTDGSWGPWYEAETLDGVGAEELGRRHAAPNRSSSAAPPPSRSPSPAHPTHRPRRRPEPAADKPDLGYVPATVEQPFGAEHQRRADQPAAGAGGPGPAAQRASPPPGQPPNIISRAQWGADEAMRCGEPALRHRDPRRRRAPHRRQQRLLTAGLGGHRQVDLRVPHPHAGLVRHRLQRAGGQVRPGVRGPRRRHDRPVEGAHTGGFNTEHLGRGDARQLRRRAAHADPVAHHGKASRLAAGPRPASTRAAPSC